MTQTHAVADTWLDRWGHFVLWMGSYILIVSLIAWTPRLALLLAGIELLQFTLHVRRHHPTHPMTPISSLFVSIAIIMIMGGVLFYPLTMNAFVLVYFQISFSSSVHRYIHSSERRELYWLTSIGFTSLATVLLMIALGTIPGIPGIYAYSITE